MTSFETGVVLLAGALLFVAAFLAMAETGLSRIDRFRAEALAEQRRRGAVALVRLVDSPEQFSPYLNGILLLLLAAQIVASTSVAYLALRWFTAPWFVVAVVVEIVVVYVFAEAMPKTWAIQHPEQSALLAAPVIAALVRILPTNTITRPLIWSANLLLPGKGLKQGPFVYEQQILALADTAAKEKAIERHEHALIHSVIEFGNTVAREVMVPRPDMVTVGSTASVQDAIDVAIEHGFSRIPVYSDEPDEIIGVLFTKDLMGAMNEDRVGEAVSSLVRPAKYIPETKRVAELLREMQREKLHMAIVIDEHGSVVGLVTLEDLIEEVVGDISDEYDAEEAPEIEELGPGEWRLDARMSVHEVNERLELQLPLGDWDTVGGLVIDVFERVPARGESIVVDGFRFTVEQVLGRRIVRARIAVVPVSAGESSEV